MSKWAAHRAPTERDPATAWRPAVLKTAACLSASARRQVPSRDGRRTFAEVAGAASRQLQPLQVPPEVGRRAHYGDATMRPALLLLALAGVAAQCPCLDPGVSDNVCCPATNSPTNGCASCTCPTDPASDPTCTAIATVNDFYNVLVSNGYPDDFATFQVDNPQAPGNVGPNLYICGNLFSSCACDTSKVIIATGEIYSIDGNTFGDTDCISLSCCSATAFALGQVVAASASGDPHFQTAHGDRFDFRGETNVMYNVLSHSNVSVNALFQDADFRTAGFRQKLVHGSFMRAVFATVVTNASHTLKIEFSANRSSLVMVDDGASVHHVASGQAVVFDNVVISLAQRELSLKTPEWIIMVRSKVVPGMIGAPTCGLGRCSVDIKVLPLFDADHALVAPHGLIGQSFDGDKLAVVGKTDSYKADEITTAAMGEGAIEGSAKSYKMADKFSTDFEFSRFGAKSALPRDASKLTGLKSLAKIGASAGAESDY